MMAVVAHGRSTITAVVAALLLVSSTQPALALFEPRYSLIAPGISAGGSSLAEPWDAAIDADGNIYVVERAANRVQKFAPSGAFLRDWGGFGSAIGQFANPRGIAVDADGNVYVADTGNDRIQKFTANGGYIRQWGTGGTDPWQFQTVSAIAVDPAGGGVYVVDSEANRVLRFTADGDPVVQWGSFGMPAGSFIGPEGIAVDRTGNVFVADTGNHRIQKFSRTGDFRWSWGTLGNAAGDLYQPSGVAIDHEGRVLVVERGNVRVQRFTAGGAHLGTFANGTMWTAGKPEGIAAGPTGMVYVADGEYDKMVRFQAVPPDTTVTGPTGLIRDATPTFMLKSSQTKSTFQCRLKGSGKPFAKCPSSYTTPVLDDGLHILVVRAVDAHGLNDPTPAEHEFRVDATPPQTWFEITPPASTTNRSPSFSFSASERGTFQCSLDGAAFAACTSPKKMPTLSYGFHTFKVRAKDRAGNLDPTPASHRFEVRA